MTKNIFCKNCGFENKKEIKNIMGNIPKKKVCSICKETYEGSRKNHINNERHDNLKSLYLQLIQIKDIEKSNISTIINGMIKVDS